MSEFRRRLMMAKSNSSIPNYLCFTALEDNSTITRTGTYAANLEYSSDGNIWSAFDNTITISLDTGDYVYFRGNNNRLATSTSNSTKFVMTGQIAASGNIMSLLYKENFEENFSLTQPFTFALLFYGCTSLTSVPELPATTMASNCYRMMFRGCTSLTSVPSGLLPSNVLDSSCYLQMFYGCTQLQKTPILPAPILTGSCYSQMFSGCRMLNEATMLATDISASSCLNNWLQNVASSGIVYKNAQTTLPSGTGGVPNGWTAVNYQQ